VDVAALPGALVLVTNGVYASGERAVVWVLTPMNGTMITNRLVIDKPVTVQSVNGPTVTAIEGTGPGVAGWLRGIRCAYLGPRSLLSGFTLTNGQTGDVGGGAHCATSAILTNCIIAGNSAGTGGGGVFGGMLYNCKLTRNTNGVLRSTLYNCILTGNSGGMGSGRFEGTFHDCLLTANSVVGQVVFGSLLYNCTVTGNSGPYSYGLGTHQRSELADGGCDGVLPFGEAMKIRPSKGLISARFDVDAPLGTSRLGGGLAVASRIGIVFCGRLRLLYGWHG
jgi:hypothetical protein